MSSKLDDILLKQIAAEYYYEGSTSDSWEDNKDVLEPAKQAIKDLMLIEVVGKAKTIDLRSEKELKALVESL